MIDQLCVLLVGDGVNVGLDVSFDSTYGWKGIREKAGKLIITKLL
jgi:hypothetical protein